MYNYETHKPFVFTDEGQRALLACLAFARKACKLAGAVRNQELTAAAIGVGDGWDRLALVDRLIELGYIRKVTRDTVGQDEIYVAAHGLRE